MSFRYAAGINKPGFNPLAAQTTTYDLYAWGYNASGQLGLGTTTRSVTPSQVSSSISWTKIFTGRNFGIATKPNGTLWMWGGNAIGQLGLGDTTNRSSPTQVGALTNWLNVSGGYSYTLATKTDGTLWSWGYNAQGQLGLGNTTNYSSPSKLVR